MHRAQVSQDSLGKWCLLFQSDETSVEDHPLRFCLDFSLAMMELCQVAGNFFRRFDAKLDHRMTDEMFIQNDTFNAQPQGAQLHVHLTDRFRRE